MKHDIQAGCKDQQCQGKATPSAKKVPALPAASQRSLSTALPRQIPTLKHRSQRTQEEVFVTKSR